MDMTQSQIAEKAGISQAFVSQILKDLGKPGGKRPSPDVAARLEAVTGVHRLHWLYPRQFDPTGKANKQPATS